jgi:hypothetical protein
MKKQSSRERFSAIDRSKPGAGLATGDSVPSTDTSYSLVQAAFFFDDFTQASTKATPSTPSWTVG